MTPADPIHPHLPAKTSDSDTGQHGVDELSGVVAKYKRLRTTKKAKACWQRITRQHPRLFAHWAWVHGSWWTG